MTVVGNGAPVPIPKAEPTEEPGPVRVVLAVAVVPPETDSRVYIRVKRKAMVKKEIKASSHNLLELPCFWT